MTMFDAIGYDSMTTAEPTSPPFRGDTGITVLVGDRQVSVTVAASRFARGSAIVVLANGSIRVAVTRAPAL